MVSFFFRKKSSNNTAKAMIWSILCALWLIVTIVDSVTLSNWVDTCSDASLAVQDIYGDKGLRNHPGKSVEESIGDPLYLKDATCSNGSYIALIITTSTACVAAAVNVCISGLSSWDSPDDDEPTEYSEEQPSYHQL